MLWSWQACVLVLCTFTAGDRIFSAFCIWEGGCIELLLILPEATRRTNHFTVGSSGVRGEGHTRTPARCVSRGSAGEYQADERAGVARLSWRVSGR